MERSSSCRELLSDIVPICLSGQLRLKKKTSEVAIEQNLLFVIVMIN